MVNALNDKRFTAMTEENGEFVIKVPTFVTALYIHAPQYLSQQVGLGKSGSKVQVYLLPDQFQPMFDNTTPIQAAATATIRTTTAQTVETDIEGRLGADMRTITRSGGPGYGAAMFIRSLNSLNANAQPLFIIDGNMVDLEEDRPSLHEGYNNNLLAGLDPDNVESIKVLKNGTALYGAKGANGVVIINTKRGHSMATKINVRVYGGTEFIPSKIKMMDGDAYRNYVSELAGTVKEVRESSTSSLNKYTFLNDAPESSNYYYSVFHNNTNWQDNLYRNTFTQNYKVSVEGGDEIGMYALSLGYANGTSTLKGNDFSRLNLRFNTDIQIFSKLRAALDIAYNQTSYNVMDSGWSENYDMQNIGSSNVLGLLQAPFLSPYAYYHSEATGKLELSDSYAGKYASTALLGQWVQNPFQFANQLDPDINESLRNPYWILENGKGKNKNYAEMTQISINFAPKYRSRSSLPSATASATR
jgi:TonB-dependent SusC/RagA subfamily outer membrane receptor